MSRPVITPVRVLGFPAGNLWWVWNESGTVKVGQVSFHNDRLTRVRVEYYGDPFEIFSRKEIEAAIDLYYDRLIAASDTTYDDEDEYSPVP